LLPLVYDELRKLATARMAEENAGHTLQPSALVHEAFLRLVGSGQPQDWSGRGHFFTAVAMRRILGSNKYLCDDSSQQDFLLASGLGLFGLGLGNVSRLDDFQAADPMCQHPTIR
jgi:ECF sigma factor